MKSLLGFTVLFCVAVSCTSEKKELHEAKLPLNKYPINFVSHIKIESEGNKVALQVYTIKNQDQDTIYVKTVKEPRFNTSLLKKLYENHIRYRYDNRTEWYYMTESNAGGSESIDSVILLPKQFMLFAIGDKLHYDTIQFDIEIKKRQRNKFEFFPVTKTMAINSDSVYYDLEN